MKKEKYIETLEIDKKILEFIKEAMDAYSENGDLYDEFGIEEDCNLHSFYVDFDDNSTAAIHLNSGQNNCYVDYIFYNANGTAKCSFVGDDAIVEGDLIEFNLNDADYIVEIKAL